MKHGAVAVIDALGVKGIWRGKSAAERAAIFESLVSIRDRALSLLDEKQDLVSVRAFSDTIVMSSSESPDVGPMETLANAYAVVTNLMILTAAIAATAARTTSGRPLAYRGAIAYGEFDIRDEFWMGPAIDEAASAERLADAALVWCCPSALHVVEQLETALEHATDDSEAQRHLKGVRIGSLMIRNYDVPLKHGRVFRTHVVNPFVLSINRADVESGILKSFGDSPDLEIWIKRQNTERFLKTARQQMAGE